MIELSRGEFKRAATLGLGRAILYAREPGSSLDEEVIRHVMLHNTAYDPQVEGTRGWYVMQLIRATHHEEMFIQELRRALEDIPPNDTWDESHRMWIAGLFVDAGHLELKELLYARTVANIDAGYTAGIEAVVTVDAAAGVDFLVNHYTRFGYDLVPLYDNFACVLNEEDEAYNLPLVQKLRSEAEARRDGQQKTSPWCQTYREFKDALAQNPGRLRNSPGGWVRSASERDLADAAAELLAASSDAYDRLLAYLSVFTRRPFPLDPEPLIALARKYDGQPVWSEQGELLPQEMIAYRAFRALEKINHVAVRAFALENISQGINPDLAVGLLESNYQPGDWQLIADVAGREHSEGVIHGLGMSVKTIAAQHPEPEALPALVSLIERGPCSMCRHRLLEGMRLIGPLPEPYVSEAQFDSQEDIREWALAGFPVGSAGTS